LGLLLVALPGSVVYGQSTPPRDAAEAWKWMNSQLKNAGISGPALRNGVVSGKVKSGEFTIHLATVSSVAPYAQESGFPNLYAGGQWYGFPYVSSAIGYSTFHAAPLPGQVYRVNADAQRFRAALVYLARQAQQEQAAKDAADLEAFKPKAAAWRQMKVKPAMPEEALRHQVVAEYAYKQKDVPKAITEYSEALRIFPYWPAGQNNLAFLAGEVGTRPGYNLAIYHMKMYLELAPNAPDAQAAQDSIFIWEDKRTTATP
jgi:tetratricopeptide (TPR) repeat protein